MPYIILIVVIAFIIYCPIFKPWFGFRRGDSRGHWFE